MKVEVMPCGPLQTNTIIITEDDTILVIDPACKDVASLGLIKRRLYVILTHGHWDHMLGLPFMTVSEVYMHRKDVPMLKDPVLNGSLRGLYAPFTVDIQPLPLCEGLHTLGKISFIVYHTPGHTPGSVSLYFPDDEIAVVGDFLFSDTIGRTDLPGGSSRQMRESIRRFMSLVDGDTLVYPGHGQPFYLKHHPFFRRGRL